MKIGITERGDASINTIWYPKLLTKGLDGAILITKNVTDDFIQRVIRLHKAEVKLIIHATCTGWGGTWMEPNVPDYKTQINQVYKLIQDGFPANCIVLRIDPIIPNDEGLQRVHEVMDYAKRILPLYCMRIRVSILDEYPHVKKRLRDMGKESIYPGNQFQASIAQMQKTADLLCAELDLPYVYETCAENTLVAYCPERFLPVGCVSVKDMNLMGLSVPEGLIENMQNRRGCHCLSCKTELLNTKGQCPHRCVYCYWKG